MRQRTGVCARSRRPRPATVGQLAPGPRAFVVEQDLLPAGAVFGVVSTGFNIGGMAGPAQIDTCREGFFREALQEAKKRGLKLKAEEFFSQSERAA